METYTETRIISLNSLYANDKKNTTYLSDVEFYFKNILKDEPNIVRSTIQLVNAQIPVSFYSINFTNDIFKFSWNTPENVINIQITRGNYNSSSLITELQNKLLTAGYTFTISISRITGIMSFSSTNLFYIWGNPLGNILGFNTELGAVFNGTTWNLTAPFPLNLLGIQKLKLFSTALACNSFDSYTTGNNNLINTITVNAPPFGIILYETPTEPLILKSKTINTIDLQIYDDNNNFINFNNCNWNMTFQLNIVRIQPILTSPIKTITDVLEQELQKIDMDIQSLANPQPTEDNSAQDLGDSTDNIVDPENTLDFLQYSGQI
jgi:hypothetical protein